MSERPKVGVGMIAMRDGNVLLGRRRNAHGEGAWGFPGGHLEWCEDIFECAERELNEETGLFVKNLRCGPFTNDRFIDEGKHYVTLYVLGDCEEGAPELREPEKCDAWVWFPWHQLPTPLFLPVKNLLEMGFDPFTRSHSSADLSSRQT
jgi:8-oxo-dGTP diphosphatase